MYLNNLPVYHVFHRTHSAPFPLKRCPSPLPQTPQSTKQLETINIKKNEYLILNKGVRCNNDLLSLN